MKYLYILLFSLVLYYLISNLYQNFSNSEHFDSSLVPVSSIVTLAKIAQKLIDGNSTLTNPGNLNIGVASTPGNLTVTGNTTLGLPGTTTNIAGNTTINNNLNINGVTKLRQIHYHDNDDNSRIIFYEDGNNYYDSGPGNKHYIRGNKGNTDTEVNIFGMLRTNSLVVSGVTNLNGNTTINPNLRVVGDISTGEGKISINNGTINMISDGGGGLYLSKSKDMSGPGTNLNTGDTNIKGTLSVRDNAIFGNTNSKGNLNINGNLNTNILKNDDFMILKMLLTLYRFNTNLKGPMLCTQATPVVLINGWITATDLTAYPYPIGEHQCNTPTKYVNNDQAGRLNNGDDSNDCANYVYIYPGYGMQGWSSWSFLNDDTNIKKPMTMENNTTEIMYYSLTNGAASTEKNILKSGVNLWNNQDPKPADIPNLKDVLSSFKVYKLILQIKGQ